MLRPKAGRREQICCEPLGIAQDAKNRRWIEEVAGRLEKHEQQIAPRLEQLYQKKWAPPIPVDVVETVKKQFPLPGDLWHVVLFYTTGEVVRGALSDAGETGYTPVVNEIFDRGTWVNYRAALESVWRADVNGEKPLAEVAASFIDAIRNRR